MSMAAASDFFWAAAEAAAFGSGSASLSESSLDSDEGDVSLCGDFDGRVSFGSGCCDACDGGTATSSRTGSDCGTGGGLGTGGGGGGNGGGGLGRTCGGCGRVDSGKSGGGRTGGPGSSANSSLGLRSSKASSNERNKWFKSACSKSVMMLAIAARAARFSPISLGHEAFHAEEKNQI